jgi:uroporphyrinogen-III synthase
MPGADGPLAGRVILLTRPAGRAGPLARRLTALGAEVDARPTIAFAPPRERDPVRRALARLDDYDWIAFTSASGVERFAARCRARGRGRPRARVAVVGEATARRARRAGLGPDVVAGDPRAAGLAAALAGAIEPGARVLLVQPERTVERLAAALAAAGARVDAVAFYRTVSAPQAAGAASALVAGRYDVVLLTSPSTLHALLEAGGARAARALARIAVVAIGPTTAAAVRAAGLVPAAIADDPSAEGLARAVLAATVLP